MGVPVLLDHTGSPIRHKERPNVAKLMRAKFDAVQTTDENIRYWANADYLGPNAELQPNIRRTLRSRARYECANNSYAAGMLRTLANDLVGTGPSLQVTDRNIAADLAEEVENLFWEWCLTIDLPLKLRQMRMAKARDGETFGLLSNNTRSQSPVMLDLQVIEADMVADPSWSLSKDSLKDGIITDDWGNVVGYRVLYDHPGELTEWAANMEARTLPARSVIHLAHLERPGQYRGVSEITPSLPLFAQLRRYTLAVLRSAESAALISWIIESNINADADAFSEAEPFDTVETERGMGMTLPYGYKMAQLKAEQPVDTYPQFKREILSEIARCLGIPYNVAAGDSSSYNYSSGRLDHRTYYKALRVERSVVERKTLDVLLRNWWVEATSVNNYLPNELRGMPAPPRHQWRWDGDEHVDPTKEAEAAVTRLSSGLTTFADECGRLGGDVSVVHQKNAEALGLSLDEYRQMLAAKLFGVTLQQPEQPQDDGSTPNE